VAGIAHEEDSATEWFAAQFPNIGKSLLGMFWDWMNAQADARGGAARVATESRQAVRQAV